MKKKKKEGSKGLPGWYATYGDMITVLMVFFVLLFSMSVIDEELFEMFIASFNPDRQEEVAIGRDGMLDLSDGLLPDQPPPDPTPPPAPPGEGGAGEGGDDDGTDGDGAEGEILSDMMNAFRTYMAEHDPDGLWEGYIGVEDDEEANFLRITLPAHEGMLFASGQAVLLPPAMAALDMIGQLLADFVNEGHIIVVEGHTDSVPQRSAMFPSNRHLSSARASAVEQHLINYWGLNPHMVIPVGMAELDPIATNYTPEGRAANRRVEIKVFEVDGAPGTAVGGWLIPMN